MNLSQEEKNEIKTIITWAISEGYMTNTLTKDVLCKLGLETDIMIWLDKNVNVGEKLV